MDGQPVTVRMAAAVRFEGKLLRVGYRIRNEGPGDVGLFNRLPTKRLDGTLHFGAENVYIDVESGAEPVLHLRKMALPVPEGLAVAVRETPFITPLAEGQEFVEDFALHVPVAACNPLREAQLVGATAGPVAADAPVDVQAVVMSIGVFAIAPSWRLIPATPLHSDIVRIWPPGPPVDGQWVVMQRMALDEPLPTLDYRALEPQS
jgi:hypothetical protein